MTSMSSARPFDNLSDTELPNYQASDSEDEVNPSLNRLKSNLRKAQNYCNIADASKVPEMILRAERAADKAKKRLVGELKTERQDLIDQRAGMLQDRRSQVAGSKRWHKYDEDVKMMESELTYIEGELEEARIAPQRSVSARMSPDERDLSESIARTGAVSPQLLRRNKHLLNARRRTSTQGGREDEPWGSSDDEHHYEPHHQ
ncbi:hypothetical protein JCM11641_003691 [Rhodosporidiobolus odoratus]